MDLAQLQAEVGEWSRRNFPNNTPNEPFHGMVEEIGELAAAIVNQNRHDEIDAIADLVIFAADYCYRRGLNMEQLFTTYVTVVEPETPTNWLLTACDHLGAIARARLKIKQVIRGAAEVHEENERRAVGSLLRAICNYAGSRGFYFDDIVEKTWNKVKQRDWTKNRETGEATT